MSEHRDFLTNHPAFVSTRDSMRPVRAPPRSAQGRPRRGSSGAARTAGGGRRARRPPRPDRRGIAGAWMAIAATHHGRELIAAGLLLLSGLVDGDQLLDAVRTGCERGRGSLEGYDPGDFGPTIKWTKDALLCEHAASDIRCCRGDGPTSAGEPAVRLQGLDSPGQAQLRCAPDTKRGPSDASMFVKQPPEPPMAGR